MRDCGTCGHPNDPDAQHCQNLGCECPRYTAVGADADICPECDHDAEEHDAAGCREWTPAWPRLVRCGCKLSFGTIC